MTTLKARNIMAKINAMRKLEKYDKRIIWIEKYSNDATSEILVDLNFVYIDGNYQEEYVWNDIINYILKIKRSGVIGGHYVCNGFQRDHDGIVNSVIKWAVENTLPAQVELPEWWVKL